MNLSIFRTTLATAALARLTATSAFAADIAMNVGFGAPEESLQGRFGKLFEEKAEEYTNGDIDATLRYCNQISSEDEAFEAMQRGTGNDVSPHRSLMDVTVPPCIFQDDRHLKRIVDGEVGALQTGTVDGGDRHTAGAVFMVSVMPRAQA